MLMEQAMGEGEAGKLRVASCACGALRVTTRGEPSRVNICACHICQKRSGSAFTYTAFFAQSDASVEGDSRSWRTFSDTGRWQDWHFCPACGADVFSMLESMPDTILVRVGCFADADFPGPPKFYWSSKRHRWLTIPEGVEPLETQ
jgi:hypothetical protein